MFGGGGVCTTCTQDYPQLISANVSYATFTPGLARSVGFVHGRRRGVVKCLEGWRCRA